MKQLGAIDKREVGRWLEQPCEEFASAIRRREQAMVRFRRTRSLQKFAALHGSIQSHFNQERTLISPQIFKIRRTAPLNAWHQICAA